MSPRVLPIVASLLMSPLVLGGPEIHLEGKPEARAKLDAISFKPLDASLLGKLTEWRGGEGLTAEAIKGKPVLFVTWSSWYKTSFEALSIAQTLAAKYEAQGLIVVGVHHKQGWDRAADVAKTRGATFRMALDQGEFRKALDSTQDPDFYLVDRAGRLRFADIETRSVEAATELVVNETVEQATAAKPEATAAAAAAGENTPADAASPAAETAATGFTAPSADEYKAAKWPAHNAAGNLSAKNFQGKALPKPLGREKYLDRKPERAGKVTVVDFWATWCGPCRKAMPKLDELQKQHPNDLVVIGVSDEPEKTVRAFLKSNPHGYAQAIDTSRTVSNALQIQGIPHVVVLSSDGTVRWQGNPLESSFTKTVADVIAADPGVKARSAGK